MDSMRSLLDPKAVAVVGASQRRGRGTSVVANLRDCGFDGEILAVNPRYDEIAGLRVVGIAGGPDKCRHVVQDLKFDACIDYKQAADVKSLAALISPSAGSYSRFHQCKAASVRCG